MPPPPIALHYKERRRPDADEGIKLKLRSEPGNPGSAEYTFFMRFLRAHENDPEYFCDWVIDLKKVIAGQNINGGPARYRLVRDLLQGRHLFDFNSFAQEEGAETIPHFETCIRRLGLQIFPKQSKSRQVFALRNAVKPDRSAIRDFFGRLKDIAVKMEEVEPLGLDENDWKDILVRAMPEHYVRRMFDHGFNPDDHNLLETMNILERFETADGLLKRPTRATGSPRRRRDRPIHRRKTPRVGRRRPFRRRRNFPPRTPFPNNRFSNRSSPNRQSHNGFPSNRRFNPNFNRRPGLGGNNNNHQRRNNGRRFGRDRSRNNNNGGGRFNRRQQEANVLDVLRREGSTSDTSL